MTSPLRATSTTPKRETSLRLDGERGEGDVGAGVLMLAKHLAVVHFVDVIAGENEDVLGLLGADGIDVLVDGVGGAHVPVGADALHGGQDLDELAELLGDDAGPAFADVAIERESFVLGEDVNAAEIGVDAVGKGDIDDAVLPAKRNGWFGAVAREREKAFACAARQKYA